MDGKKIKNRLFLAGVTALTAYSAVSGKGPFNKYRFKKQHEALANYVDTNYPNCSYSAITAHGKGWSAAILRGGKAVKFVYFSVGDDGNYIFTELDERIK